MTPQVDETAPDHQRERGDSVEHEGKASGPQSAVKVLIVDDHPLAREGLRVILERLGKLSVVGLASNGAEALDLVAKSRPDVVVMDVRMPIMDGVEATRKIVERFPETRVVLITGYEDLPVLEDAVLAGASGLLLKDANIALLLGTISVVTNGGLVIKRDFFPGLVEAFVHASRLHRRDGAQRAPHVLTSREMEVLDLLSRGLSNKEIARALHIAEVTVKKHVQKIVDKLGAADRTHAVLTAVRIGLIQ